MIQASATKSCITALVTNGFSSPNSTCINYHTNILRSHSIAKLGRIFFEQKSVPETKAEKVGIRLTYEKKNTIFDIL